jgi:hypothetical protein
MNRLKAFAIASCLGLLAVAFLPSSKADEWNKKTIMTINEPLAIPGKVLQPGKYVMKLADSQSNRHIVQIFNEDESQIQATILAIPNYRIQPTGKTQFGFWEMPAGQARALKAWFYPGDNFGQEFAYPKDVATTIARANNENVPTAENEKAEVSEVTPAGQTQPVSSDQQNQTAAAAPAPEANAASSSTTSTDTQSSNAASSSAAAQPAPAPEPAAAPAPAPEPAPAPQAEPAPAPAPAPAAQPASSGLPRTASPYPLAGLAGLLSLGGAIAARFIAKRAA